ncbi:MAG: sulfite exporter TauE/SafE family protein [Desulfobacteraceae bacterium]|nr:sulfite exporter TauE/SafE family protein [Desulfobacteraceae bacterium]
MNRLFKSPWLEVNLMLAILILSYIALALISWGAETPPEGMSGGAIWGWLLGFFLLSFAIALVAVIGGIGGGVLFTPFMLAFTSVDSLIVRATGLIVAMFSGLVSTGPFMRGGLANLRICIFCAAAYGVGAFTGAKGAIYVAKHLGETGEGLVRLALGIILCSLAVYFVVGGRKIEWPEVKKVDGFTKWLRLSQPYYEVSLGKIIDYPLTRAGWVLLPIIGIGLLSGFFGLGAGWAIVPAQNLIMAVPLKVAAANSGVLLGMGDCIAVWPYLLMGAIIPIFAAPWLVGQVLGGLMGALILIRVKAGFVRYLLIGFMFFACFGLLTKGLNMLGVIWKIPIWITGAVFILIFAAVIRAILKQAKSDTETGG